MSFQSNAFQSSAFQVLTGLAEVVGSDDHHHFDSWTQYQTNELKRKIAAENAELARVKQELAEREALAEKENGDQLQQEINQLRILRAELIRLIREDETILIILLMARRRLRAV